MTSLKTLAFEIGTEEIPAFDLHSATKQLESLGASLLDGAGVPHGAVRGLSTPRRLILMVDDVAESTEAIDEVFRGPAAKIALDDQGGYTKAALGFARGKGVGPEALEMRSENGVDYLYAVRHRPSVPTAGLIGEALGALIEGLSWPKSCRWARRSESFSRPVRWIVALLGSQVVPVSFAGVQAGRHTWGHRVLSPGTHEVASAELLPDLLRSLRVVPSEAEREQAIREGVAAIERETGLRAELPAKTLLEVVNLSEAPTVLCGRFDEDFLRVPDEIIVDAMLMHQRYFPLYDAAGALTNRFIVVSNGDPAHGDVVIAGNERVVRARLDDAKFFYEEDLKRPLESYVEKLDQVVFQEALGTTRAKAQRIEALAAWVAREAGLSADEVAAARRAGLLCKADLVTNAVIEFTSVQGVMGGYYAQASGEGDLVAQAVRDHYRPRFSGDEPPASAVGRAVAAADKLDTICGLFAVGQGPTGSSDPFALRRSALGIIAMLGAGLRFPLAGAVDEALAAYEAQGVSFDRGVARAAVTEFFITRARVALRDEGHGVDAIDAVLAVGVDDPAVLATRVRALEAARSERPEAFDDLATAYARANNLRDAAVGVALNEGLLSQQERAVVEAAAHAEVAVSAALGQGDYAQALSCLAALRTPIDAFFASTRVMDDDLALRANHLAVLNRFVAAFAQVADFGKMAKSAGGSGRKARS
ncbi:glycine--tRNA ligase subunit beta [Eggerthellaceae bacterium zg-997]|nr:glycine--tRNA ligase subunit beta [Eggerthellaceae bacterium zg-997]